VTTGTTDRAVQPQAQELVREYHDARRREDQWRIPQILSALVAPVMALVSVVFLMMGDETAATVTGALAVIIGIAAALLAVEVWRWHRTAIGIANSVRDDYPAEANLLLRDPL
jgi:protein-S-isoprenylcysteine O-methyltransferase Ste14